MVKFSPVGTVASLVLASLAVLLVLLWLWQPMGVDPEPSPPSTTEESIAKANRAQGTRASESRLPSPGRPPAHVPEAASEAPLPVQTAGPRAGQETGPAEDFRAVVEGQITDSEGESVGGAKVTMFGHFDPDLETRFSERLREVSTGSDGFYRMAVRQPLKVFLTVDMSGYEVLEDSVDLSQAAHLRKDYVLPAAAGQVWGIIREAGSRRLLPDVGVALSFVASGSDPRGWVYSRDTKSDSNGRYSFERVRMGWDFAVLADDPDHLLARAKAYLEPDADELRLDLELRPSKSVQVKVVNSNGEPVPDAQIAVAFLRTPPAFTDQRGLAKLEVEADTPAESVNCRVVADGYLDRITKLSLEAETAEIVLEAGPLAKGLVSDSSGRRLAGATILINSGPDGNRAHQGSRSDEDGLFAVRLKKVPMRSIEVRHPGFLSSKKTLEEGVLPGFMTIELERGTGSISGRIVSEEGRPLSDFGVGVTRRASDLHSEGQLRKTVRDSQGRFELDGLPDGTYDLVVSWRDPENRDHFQLGRIQGIEIYGGRAVNSILLQLRTLRPER